MNNNCKIKQLSLFAVIFLISIFNVKASDKFNYRTPPQFIQHDASKDAFTIVANGKATSIYVDASDWKGVIRAANDLGDDVRKVSGIKSEIVEKIEYPAKGAILIGTIGKSKIIDQLIAEKKNRRFRNKRTLGIIYHSNCRWQFDCSRKRQTRNYLWNL